MILLLVDGCDIADNSTEINKLIQKWDNLISKIPIMKSYTHTLVLNLTPQKDVNITSFDSFALEIFEAHVAAGRLVKYEGMFSLSEKIIY